MLRADSHYCCLEVLDFCRVNGLDYILGVAPTTTLRRHIGDLEASMAAGYVKVGRDRIEKNPDKRVQQAIQLVFTKFTELQSARQVHIWLRDEGIELPAKSRRGEAHGVVWRLPAYNIVHNILTNPIYAGAYAFGRTTSRISVVDGRKRVRAVATSRAGRSVQVLPG
jgi:hypothetical protein